MSVFSLMTILLGNLASIITIALVVYKFLYKKPYTKGYRQGIVEGRKSGLREGVTLGFGKSRAIGRRKDNSRNLDHLINNERILALIEQRDTVSDIYTNNIDFQAETKNYVVSLYSGLKRAYDQHVEEIERKINIGISKGKRLLVILVLLGAPSEIINERISTYDKIREYFRDNENIEFNLYIGLEVRDQAQDLEEVIGEILSDYEKEHPVPDSGVESLIPIRD